MIKQEVVSYNTHNYLSVKWSRLLFYSLSENPTTKIGKTIDDRVEKRLRGCLVGGLLATPSLGINLNSGSHASKIGLLRFMRGQKILSCQQEVDRY